MEIRLPRSFERGGTAYRIRWDCEAALDIFKALNDPALGDEARAYAALHIFYPDADLMPRMRGQEACEKLLWFLRGGKAADPKRPDRRLIDWEQDFPLIVSPVNRVLGYDIRQPGRRVHWWTFLSAFDEIGDCLFSQVVHIRSMRARGKPMDKSDQAFYRENRYLIDFQTTLSEEEGAWLDKWMGKGAATNG